MSEIKHTLGPWTLETVRTSVGVCFKVGPFPWKQGKLNHACIYADYPSSAEHAECLANARLIAAAPDLLEALQELVAEAVEVWEYAEDYAHIERARAALSKATGLPQP